MNSTSEPPQAGRFASLKLLGIVSVIDAAFFSLTSPQTSHSLLIIAGICLLVAGIYVWTATLVRVLGAFWPLTLRTKWRLVMFLTVMTSLLIVMQSIGQLSWRDALVIIPFVAVLYAYIAYVAIPASKVSRQ